MEPTDLFPRRDGVERAPQPTSMPIAPDTIEMPPRIEDVIELYKRFHQELDNLPRGALSGPTPPRLKVFNELSFSELFRLNALWHRVERPRPPDEMDDANARHARLEERRWDNFYYSWAQPALQERWAHQYGLVRAGGDVSWKRLLGKTNIRTYWDARVDYPPWCDHTTLWRIPIKKGDNPHLAQVLVTQPYGYRLDEMTVFAADKGLWFWISERPAWHYPNGVHFIEWAAPGSLFARKRNTSAMHELFRTRDSYTPGH